MDPIHVKNYVTGGAVGPNRIVKFGSADNTVVLAAAATDKPIGVSRGPSTLGSVASGDRIDVVRLGIYPVVAGGTITRGDPITSDASGGAVTAAPSAGTNNGIIGRAETSAVSGDLVDVYIAPGSFQG
jgi:hypothetical protein